jgi:hypothetical protein
MQNWKTYSPKNNQINEKVKNTTSLLISLEGKG